MNDEKNGAAPGPAAALGEAPPMFEFMGMPLTEREARIAHAAVLGFKATLQERVKGIPPPLVDLLAASVTGCIGAPGMGKADEATVQAVNLYADAVADTAGPVFLEGVRLAQAQKTKVHKPSAADAQRFGRGGTGRKQ